MTASGMKGLIRGSTVIRSDRGGSSMNLIQKVLMNLGSGGRENQHIRERENIIDDYGYEIYKSLEYNIRNMKNDNVGYDKKLLNTIIR